MAQPGVTGAMVVLENAEAHSRLVANVTAEKGVPLNKRAIVDAVLEQFPTAAVPIINLIKELPVTGEGKLDRP